MLPIVLVLIDGLGDRAHELLGGRTASEAAATPNLDGLAAGGSSRPSGREQVLAAEVDELTTALGEAHVQLRVWKRSAEHHGVRLAPTRTSR